jgi:hypothetical protein
MPRNGAISSAGFLNPAASCLCSIMTASISTRGARLHRAGWAAPVGNPLKTDCLQADGEGPARLNEETKHAQRKPESPGTMAAAEEAAMASKGQPVDIEHLIAIRAAIAPSEEILPSIRTAAS